MTENILLSKITPAPFQPRKSFDEVKLQELANSMKEQGLIQAITVRPLNGGYQLIAGERRFRAAKLLGWKEIKAEVQDMDDLEAEEKSVVENVHRGDITGQEMEDVVFDLWTKGNKETGDGRYTGKESLSKRLGWSHERVGILLSAKEARERMGLKRGSATEKSVTTYDLNVTSNIKNDSDRKSLLEKKVNGTITTGELLASAKIVANAEIPKAIKEAVLEQPKRFTPEVANAISEISDEKVRDVTIGSIKKFRLDPEESINLAKSAKEPAFTKEEPQDDTDVAEITKRTAEYAKLLDQWKQGNWKGRSGSKGVGRSFANIMALTGVINNLHSCSCPHCGKDSSQYLRLTCCDKGKNETLDQAYEFAKHEHSRIVKEAKKAGGKE